jgi:hypothetical protein
MELYEIINRYFAFLKNRSTFFLLYLSNRRQTMNLLHVGKKYVVGMIACGLLALCAIPASATPVEWAVADGGNGHFYEAVVAPRTTWEVDRAAAASLTYDGMNGYLATFTTASEQNWVTANLGGGTAINSMWLGGYQDFSDPGYSEPNGGWKWITGEAFNQYGSDAPVWSFNNAYYIPGGEQYINTWWDTGGLNDFNDTDSAADVHGYIVEYSPVSVVPLPPVVWSGATLLLCLGVGAKMRRRMTLLKA